MKNTIILFLFIQLNSIVAQEFNYQYIDQEETENFRDICFVNEQVGYAASVYGPIIKSTDGGETWFSTNLVSDLCIHSIQFIDEDYGFAVGGKSSGPTASEIPGSVVFKTTDGGNTWTQTRLGDNRELYTVCFIDASTGFTGGLGNFFKTKDGGDTWHSVEFDENYNIQEIKFINGIGYAACAFGKMLKSIDGGESWQPLNTGITTGHFYTLDFIDENVGFAGGGGAFIRTTDGGTTWEELPNAPNYVNSITNFGYNYLIASGRGQPSGWGKNYGALYFSKDGGNTWTTDDALDLYSTTCSRFYSRNLGFVVGHHSKILKLTVDDLMSSGVELYSQKNNQVFPNPAEERIFFKNLDLIGDSLVTVRNLKGAKVIEELISVNGLDISRLASGLYVYQISYEHKVYNGKFLKQ